MKRLTKAMLEPLRERLEWVRLPAEARVAHRRDSDGLPTHVPGLDEAVDAAIGWLYRAQDQSASNDGGAARDYSLLSGWATSYPETSGYIIPTLIDHANLRDEPEGRERARRMLDWLLGIQFPEGGFQGGRVDSTPVVPVTFNTGQILLGLAAGTAAFGNAYREPMRRAADWLVATQDDDGCWRRHPTPFAAPGEKAYETHVAWGLLEAARLEPGQAYDEAALRNVRWAVAKQQANGWFRDCCLSDPQNPLTHTIGYVLRGVVEAYRYSEDKAYLDASLRTADALLEVIDAEGFLPGRFDSAWRGAVEWACLTGSVQIAHCWLLLYEITGRDAYLDAARRANTYVRRTVSLDGHDGIRGGIRGSFPISGAYGRFEYLNWAAKFFVDSHLLEQRLLSQ